MPINRRQIIIEELEGLKFEEIKETSKEIRVKAIPIENHSEKYCRDINCNGILKKNGYVKSSYEDIPVDGKRVFIDVTMNRYYCKECGTSYEFKPDCINRKPNSIFRYEADKPRLNHRMTNRYIEWLEYLCMKYNAKFVSEWTGLKHRRLCYIKEVYLQNVMYFQMDIRGVLVVKSRKNQKTIFLIIDSRTNGLFDLVYSAKDVTKTIKRIKDQNNDLISSIKVIIPIDFKDEDALINLVGFENISYDYRSLRTMIAENCFKAYKKAAKENEQIFDPPFHIQEYLFITPQSLLSEVNKYTLNRLLLDNDLFCFYYDMINERCHFIGYEKEYSKDKNNSTAFKYLYNKLSSLKAPIYDSESDDIIDDIIEDTWKSLDERCSKEWIILKNSDNKHMLDKFKKFDKGLEKK